MLCVTLASCDIVLVLLCDNRGADLNFFVKEATSMAMREVIPNIFVDTPLCGDSCSKKMLNVVSKSHFLQALKEIVPSVSEEVMDSVM